MGDDGEPSLRFTKPPSIKMAYEFMNEKCKVARGHAETKSHLDGSAPWPFFMNFHYNRGIQHLGYPYLMPKMPHPRHHHCHTTIIRRRNDLIVPHRSARLDDRRRTGVSDHVETIAEGEKGIAGSHRAG